MAPGATQSFRVQWVGAPDIKTSETYMVSVNQLPVKMNAGESGVQMVFSFGVIVNVAPAGAQSALKLVSAEALTEDGKRGVSIMVENPSEMYSYFSDASVSLESGGWRKDLSLSGATRSHWIWGGASWQEAPVFRHRRCACWHRQTRGQTELQPKNRKVIAAGSDQHT